MFAESLNHYYPVAQPGEKMLVGKLEGKLIAAKLLLKQGLAWPAIANLMDMTQEQIACVETHYH